MSCSKLLAGANWVCASAFLSAVALGGYTIDQPKADVKYLKTATIGSNGQTSALGETVLAKLRDSNDVVVDSHSATAPPQSNAWSVNFTTSSTWPVGYLFVELWAGSPSERKAGPVRIQIVNSL